MIIEQPTTIIENNLPASKAMGMKASAKAYDILSSVIYSRKEEAIIRELSCNAYDSHKAAGKESVPFLVHLPTTLEPWVSIRDYGVGLSADGIINTFSVFFESTKEQSNDFIGAMGIGSKSPLSYTDTYTVTGIKDGRKAVCVIYKNDDGIPYPTIVCDVETDEPTGVEVKLAVRSGDFCAFREAAKTVFSVFEVVPEIVGFTVNIESIYTNPVLGTDNMFLLPNRHGLKIVMGNIAYPLDLNAIEPSLRATFIYVDAVIVVPIGTVSFSASRETLKYDGRTVDNLNTILTQIVAKASATYREETKEMTVWDKLVKRASVSSVLWKLYDIDNNDSIVVQNPHKTIEVKRYHRDPRGKVAADRRFTISDLSFAIIYPHVNKVFLNDAKKDGVKRISAVHSGAFIMISPAKGYSEVDPTEYQMFVEALGDPTVCSVSSLPPLPRAEKEKTAKVAKSLAFKTFQKSMWSNSFNPITIDYAGSTTPKIYIEASDTSKAVSVNGELLYPSAIADMISAIRACELVMVPKTRIKDIPADWVNAVDVIIEWKRDNAEILRAAGILAGVGSYSIMMTKIHNPQGAIKEIAEIESKMDSALFSVARHFTNDDAYRQGYAKGDNMIRVLKAKYPLLRYLHSASEEDLSDYIKMVNESA